MSKELELLVPDIEGWAIYRSNDETMDIAKRTSPFIYGEHVEGCSKPFDKKEAGLGWEWWDSEPDKEDRCWKCGGSVPKEIVALVAMMMNWENIQNGTA